MRYHQLINIGKCIKGIKYRQVPEVRSHCGKDCFMLVGEQTADLKQKLQTPCSALMEVNKIVMLTLRLLTQSTSWSNNCNLWKKRTEMNIAELHLLHKLHTPGFQFEKKNISIEAMQCVAYNAKNNNYCS